MYKYAVMCICLVGCSSNVNDPGVQSSEPNTTHTFTKCYDQPKGLYKVRAVVLTSTCGGVGEVVDSSIVLDNNTTMPPECVLKSGSVSDSKCSSYSSFTCKSNGTTYDYDGYLDCANAICSKLEGEMSIKTNSCIQTVRFTYTYTR